MSVFSDHQCDSIPVRSEPGVESLRPGQIGALCALHAHWLHETGPAIISLPTGYGKTAIHTAIPFLLGSERVLLLTSSSILREQIASEFQGLGVLRGCGFIAEGVPAPPVYVLDHQVDGVEEWKAFQEYEVVIAIPEGLRARTRPYTEDEREAIAELFDLVIVDEAHHTPASTWRDLLNVFPEGTRKVLATATPFRRDEKRLPGKQVFRYPVRQAKEEGFFAEITLEPVRAEADPDRAVARRAAEILQADRENGLNHLLLVRKDRIAGAQDLADLYRDETALNLDVVHSNMPGTARERALESLRNQDVDGVIGVNMLGEGVDIPRLKIAALHDPYRSLPVTLQFIGRLARTNVEDIGRAVVIAPESKLRKGLTELLDVDNEWNHAIEGLMEFLAGEEQERQEALHSFDSRRNDSWGLETLDALTPYRHAKVFKVSNFDLEAVPDYDGKREILQHYVSGDYNCAILLTRTIQSPRWIKSEAFDGPKYDVHIVHFHEDSGLFFVTVSDKTETVYSHLVDTFTDDARTLATSDLNRSFQALERPRFLNVGLRSRLPGSHTEAYRVMAGERADVAVRSSDAKRYLRGHAFATAEDGSTTTLGTSGRSKVWSNSNSRIGNLLQWYDQLAKNITVETEFDVPSTYLSRVPMESTVSRIPAAPIAGRWPTQAFEEPPEVHWTDRDDDAQATSLLSVAIEIPGERLVHDFDDAEAPVTSFEFGLTAEDGFQAQLSFDLERADQFQVIDHVGEEPPEIGRGLVDDDERQALADFLNENPLTFFLSDMSTLRGSNHGPSPSGHRGMATEVEVDQFEVVDWGGNDISIRHEVECEAEGLCSIHEYLADRLASEDWQIVYRDHSTGEIADFVVLREPTEGEEHDVEVELIHCKASTRETPGCRLADFYDVVGQAARSAQYVHNLEQLMLHIRRRLDTCKNVGFIVGDMRDLEALVRRLPVYQLYQVTIVQPGLSKTGLCDNVAGLLGGLQDVLDSYSCEPLRVLVSE